MQTFSMTRGPARWLRAVALSLGLLPVGAGATPIPVEGFGFSPTGLVEDVIIGVQGIAYQGISHTDADDDRRPAPGDEVTLLGALYADGLVGDGLPGGAIPIDGDSGYELTASFDSWTGVFGESEQVGAITYVYAPGNTITLFVEDTSDPNAIPLFDATPGDDSLLGVDGGATRAVMTLSVVTGVATVLPAAGGGSAGSAIIDVSVERAEPGYWWLDSDGDGSADIDVSDLLSTGTALTATTVLPLADYDPTPDENSEFINDGGISESGGFFDLFSQHDAELSFFIEDDGGPTTVSEPQTLILLIASLAIARRRRAS